VEALVRDLGPLDVSVLIQFDSVLLELFKELIGLFLQLLGPFPHLAYDFLVFQVFEPVMDVCSLFMHLHESLRPGNEAFMGLFQGFSHSELLRVVDYLVHDWLVELIS
jgi:hypothetical protein